MKRTVFFSVALLSSAISFAQTNLALGGTATATAATENAGLAIDDNEGTRWEAPQAFFTNGEDVTWTLDLGSVQTFNTIQIKWEGAYSKSFILSVSEDGTDYTDVVVKTDEMLGDLLQTYSFDEVKAQYVKFTNLERATQWGVSFFEFRVFNIGASTLSAIELSAEQNVVKVGSDAPLTVKGRNQIGQFVEADDVTFEVTPADAGTVVNGIFIPAKAGIASIVAKSGELVSGAITITSYSGEKVNIFDSWAAMVTPIGDDTQTGSMVGAFDDSMGSIWEMHTGSGADEEERTYETGFVIDLQAIYDITAISATFEGACPEDYTISFAGNDGVYNDEHVVTGHPGMATFTDFFLSEAKEVRYIKLLSTKAATQYGVKMFDFSVYCENKQDIPDTEAPTDFTAAVDATVATFSSVALTLKATDDVSTNIVYAITYSDGTTTAETTTSGKSGVETTFVLGGLTAGTSYTVTVVAKDAKGNATEAIVIEAATKAMPGAAPVPEASAENVKSIYSDKLGYAEGFSLPDWGEQTVTQIIAMSESDEALMLSNMNYRGLEFTLIDVTDMETLHVDIFSETANTVTIVPIWRDTENNTNFAEIPFAIDGLTPGTWNSIDIPMANFMSDDRNGTNNVYQIKLDNGLGNTFIFDNIYFEKTAIADAEAPVWVNAEAQNVADTKAAIALKATDNNENTLLTYTVKNAEGDIVATKQAKAGDEAVIELTGLTPETEYIYSVSVEDAAGNITEEVKTVSFTTTEKVAQVTSGNGSIIIQNDVITEPQTLNYTWRFVQEHTTVSFIVECTTANEDVTGLDGAAGNIQNRTGGGLVEEVNSLIYTWENVTEGDVLTAMAWWGVAGGRAETPQHSYTVENTTTTGITSVDTSDTKQPDAIYTLSGKRVAKATKGIYIINGKKVVIR